MKILFVNKFFYLRGGLEKVLLDEVKLLKEHNHQIAVFSTTHPENLPSEYSEFFTKFYELGGKKIDASIIGKIKSLFRVIYNRDAKIRMKKLLDHFKPDIVHIHGINRYITTSIFSPIKKMGIPIVQTVHDYHHVCPNSILILGKRVVCKPKKCTRINYLPAIKNKCIKNSFLVSFIGAFELTYHNFLKIFQKNVNRFIVPSKFTGEVLASSGFSQEKIVHILNPVEKREEQDFSNQDRYLFYAGRLAVEKGLFNLLEAIEKVGDIKLLIAGTGGLEKQLTDYVMKKGLNVTFLGYVNSEDIVVYLSKAIALVLPSIWYENAPISILEAFSVRKPVIAANIGGIPEMVRDGINGLLFNPGDSNDLANKIRILIEDKELSIQLGAEGNKLVQEKYSFEGHYHSLINLYNEVIQENN